MVVAHAETVNGSVAKNLDIGLASKMLLKGMWKRLEAVSERIHRRGPVQGVG